jgi:hypothetical protein
MTAEVTNSIFSRLSAAVSGERPAASALMVSSSYVLVAAVKRCSFYRCTEPSIHSGIPRKVPTTLSVEGCHFSGSRGQEARPPDRVRFGDGNMFNVETFPDPNIPKWKWFIVPVPYIPTMMHVKAAVAILRSGFHEIVMGIALGSIILIAAVLIYWTYRRARRRKVVQ